MPADSAVGVTRGFLALIRPVVLESAGGSGCAVAAAAMANRGAALHNAAATAIGSWIDELTGRFVAAGLADAEARGLAASLTAILKDAHVLARATGGVDSFDETARMFTALVEHRFGS